MALVSNGSGYMQHSVFLACLVVAIGSVLIACDGAAPTGQDQPDKATDSAAVATDSQLRSDAAAAVQRFGAQLKGELQQAMARGGPLAAVEVCHTRAPAIADELSAQTGFQLTRVSLKHRNLERGRPLEWQREVLHSFDTQLAAGVAASELEFVATTDGEYRFMKAIPTAPLCLTCHGTAIAPELEARLTSLYPEDLATGYQAGELRGAFVAIRSLGPG